MLNVNLLSFVKKMQHRLEPSTSSNYLIKVSWTMWCQVLHKRVSGHHATIILYGQEYYTLACFLLWGFSHVQRSRCLSCPADSLYGLFYQLVSEGLPSMFLGLCWETPVVPSYRSDDSSKTKISHAGDINYKNHLCFLNGQIAVQVSWWCSD